MSSISDWLNLHDFQIAQLREMIAAVRARGLERPFSFDERFPKGVIPSAELPDLSTCEAAYSSVVVPAFAKAFRYVPELHSILAEVEFETSCQEEDRRPHTIDRGEGRAPVVIMVWRPNSPESLLHLAHETAHALQILLSEHHFMPPVAREVCAFLGELVVMAHLRTRAGGLFKDLLQIWQRDNGSYLGRDLEFLRKSLGDVTAPYDYRLNYPPARIMALGLFRGRTDRGAWYRLFSSGGEAMKLLDLEEAVVSSVCQDNPLSPVPEENTAVPAMNIYRVLGGAVILDLVSGDSSTEKSIQDYYGGVSETLKERRLHLVLDDARRPLGYVVLEKQSREEVEPCFVLERAVYCSREDLRAKVRKNLKVHELKSGAKRQKEKEATERDGARQIRIDAYAAAGYAVELLAFSDYHREFPLRDYMDVEVLPPVMHGQAHFHLAEGGTPLAMVTWAWLSPEVEREVLQTGRHLAADEWRCGDRLFFNDWIAPFGHSREVMHHLRRNVFRGISEASGLRRNQDGSVRRIGRVLAAVPDLPIAAGNEGVLEK